MASLRKTRGVDNFNPELKSLDEKRSAWGSIYAKRVLDCLFPEDPLDDGNSVVCNKMIYTNDYSPQDLAEVARNYFLDIYEKNSAGVPITPDVEDFCVFAHMNRLTFMKFCSSHSIEMAITANNIRNSIAMCKKQMAFNGQIPPVVFAIDFNNNHDYIQSRQQVEVNTTYEIEAQDSIDDIASRLPKSIEEK